MNLRRIWLGLALTMTLIAIPSSFAANTPETRQLEAQKLSQFWQEKLNSPYMLVRKSALKQLAALKATDAIPKITAMLRDSEVEVRIASARIIGLLGDDRQLPLLKEISRRDPDINVRKQAGRSMDQIKERIGRKDSNKPAPKGRS